MGPAFDPSAHGLKPVHCETVAGYIFVCFAAIAPDFAPVKARIAPYMVPHGLENDKVAYPTPIVEQGNWKLVWETNRECSHCYGSPRSEEHTSDLQYLMLIAYAVFCFHHTTTDL